MTRKIIFYGAISLDGFLAREDQQLDWLFETPGGEDTAYDDFIQQIDTTIMGRHTYEEVLSKYSGPEFMYKDKTNYVFSNALLGQTPAEPSVNYVAGDIVPFIKSLKQEEGKGIWLVGGGALIKPLIEANLIDDWYIQIAPVILGTGIPLFFDSQADLRLELVDVNRYQQFVEMHYRKIEK
ncbi:dihydrofolate reductase family protein [uncultured Vagococcus sp.]|uniref:dihydrofolate reductase family protein n=1 Tax=uncultured Vagococcus sp. TaxID=189676 RepID=UPI0028D4CA76|nr:dihydrofolate reductase family protein [uncultured Vagococcus sp.]